VVLIAPDVEVIDATPPVGPPPAAVAEIPPVT